MPYKFEKIPINNPEHDRRVKLTDDDRENIREEYATGSISQNNLAKKYGVSKRLVQFILNPEKQEISKQQFAERQKDGRYYDREKHNEQMKKHRNHKKELYEKGLLNEKDE
jgi:predicted DNA-binding protein (UPF0251 family)